MRALPWAARLLLVVAALDVALAGIVGVVCRLGGWGQRADYAHGLVYAGVALLGVGMLRYVGVASDAPQPSVTWGGTQTVLPLDVRGHPERMRRAIADSVRVAPFPLLLLAAAAPPIAAGLLLR
jgi:hypothetical protein